MKRHQGIASLVPAGKHWRMAEFNEEDVDGAHGSEKQRLDCDRKTKEDRHREVGEHTGEQDVVGKGAPPVTLLLWFLSMSTTCLWLSFASEHVDLGHRVDEDDGEDCDGEAEEEGAREVPDDATQAHGQQQHQDHRDPDEGGEKEQEEDGGARQDQGLKTSKKKSKEERA